ncbi:MAG: NF038122 family metalloprotease [Acetobacteraceae bacterium]
MNAADAVQAFIDDPSIAPITVRDTTAAVGAHLDELQALAAAGKIAAIRLTDTGTMTLTAIRFFADSDVVALLPNRRLMIVTGVSADDAGTFQTNARVKSFTVTDSTRAVSAHLDALNADTRITAVTLTDSEPVAMTYTQYGADRAILKKLPASALYAIANVPAAKAGAMQNTAKVASFSVLDNAANLIAYARVLNTRTKLTGVTASDTGATVLANLDGLTEITKLSSVILTDTDVLTVSLAQYQTYGGLFAKLASGETLAVTGVSAATAASIDAQPGVVVTTVEDTLANIGANFAELEAMAAAGTLTGIVVTDTGQTLVLTAEQSAAYQVAIALMSGSFAITAPQPDPVPARPPVINLIWDESVALAPTGFKEAVQYAASIYDRLITNEITINIEVGWGEARDTPLATGLVGEAYITSGVFRSFTQFRDGLAAHNSSATVQSVLDHLVNPGSTMFVPGAQAKALGFSAANATTLDGAIGFSSTASYTFDPANRAVTGKIDMIGLAEHELAHVLGRVTYGWVTPFNLLRYSAPGVWQPTGTSVQTYFSIDGGVTNLGNFSRTGDSDDWDYGMSDDVSAAFISKGLELVFSDADRTLINALGYAVSPTGGVTAASGDLSTVAPSFLNESSAARLLPSDLQDATLASLLAGEMPDRFLADAVMAGTSPAGSWISGEGSGGLFAAAGGSAAWDDPARISRGSGWLSGGETI